MNNIHMPSVIKAGGIAAAVNFILGILGVIPLINCLVWPLICLGWFLVPAGAGLGYGYLAPGKEDLTESAIGGALAGGFSGLVIGVVRAIGAVLGVGASILGNAEIAEGAAGLVLNAGLSLCGPIIAGLILGAIGGIVWPLVQGNKA